MGVLIYTQTPIQCIRFQHTAYTYAASLKTNFHLQSLKDMNNKQDKQDQN